jgi:hypothetical protein
VILKICCAMDGEHMGKRPYHPPAKFPHGTSCASLRIKKDLGVAADAIIGNMPLMAIPLGELLAKTGLFAGVGIMENGDISLILDLEKISSMGVRIRENSEIMGALKVGDVIKMKYYPKDALSTIKLMDTEITHITKEDQGRFQGHYLIGLSLRSQGAGNPLN